MMELIACAAQTAITCTHISQTDLAGNIIQAPTSAAVHYKAVILLLFVPSFFSSHVFIRSWFYDVVSISFLALHSSCGGIESWMLNSNCVQFVVLVSVFYASSVQRHELTQSQTTDTRLWSVVVPCPGHTHVYMYFVIPILKKRELIVLLKLYFSFYVCAFVYVLLSLPHSTIDKSVICDCGTSWSYSFIIFYLGLLLRINMCQKTICLKNLLQI